MYPREYSCPGDYNIREVFTHRKLLRLTPCHLTAIHHLVDLYKWCARKRLYIPDIEKLKITIIFRLFILSCDSYTLKYSKSIELYEIHKFTELTETATMNRFGSAIPEVRHSGGPPFRRSAIPEVCHSRGPPRKDTMGNRRLGPLDWINCYFLIL